MGKLIYLLEEFTERFNKDYLKQTLGLIKIDFILLLSLIVFLMNMCKTKRVYFLLLLKSN